MIHQIPDKTIFQPLLFSPQSREHEPLRIDSLSRFQRKLREILRLRVKLGPVRSMLELEDISILHRFLP